jgi:hypothetical protein
MEKDWVMIYTATDELMIEMVKQILGENSIEAVVFNKKDRAYLFGELELYVNRDSVIRAKSVIKEVLGE